MKKEYVPKMPQVYAPLKIGKWYEFVQMRTPHGPKYDSKFKECTYKGRVLAAYSNFYLVEMKSGRKTAVSINELSSNVKAVAV